MTIKKGVKNHLKTKKARENINNRLKALASANVDALGMSQTTGLTPGTIEIYLKNLDISRELVEGYRTARANVFAHLGLKSALTMDAIITQLYEKVSLGDCSVGELANALKAISATSQQVYADERTEQGKANQIHEVRSWALIMQQSDEQRKARYIAGYKPADVLAPPMETQATTSENDHVVLHNDIEKETPWGGTPGAPLAELEVIKPDPHTQNNSVPTENLFSGRPHNASSAKREKKFVGKYANAPKSLYEEAGK